MLVLPPYTRFLLWVVSQSTAFFGSPGGGGAGGSAKGRVRGKAAAAAPRGGGAAAAAGAAGASAQTVPGVGGAATLWPLLSAELGLTQDQEERVRAAFQAQDTDQAAAQRVQIAAAMHALARIRAGVLRRSGAVARLLGSLLDVLSPEQAVRYLAWVDRNRLRLRQARLEQGVLGAAAPPAPPAAAGAAAGAAAAAEREARLAQIMARPEDALTLADVNEMLAALEAGDYS